VAYAIWVLEMLFDTHKKEVADHIIEMKPHSLKWYANKAKAFQYGYDLTADSDIYDNSALTDEQVAQSKLVSYAAAMETETGIRLKVSKDFGGDLAPLSASELQAFSEYMARVKDAGVRLMIGSGEPDILRLSLEIYYNPLVLELYDGVLNRIDGTASDVVREGVKNYLKNLPFNGQLVLVYLVDALQAIEGIVIPHIVSAEAQYAQVVTNFGIKYAPDAGYIRLDDESFFVENHVQTVI
jgi:hypothetical protein